MKIALVRSTAHLNSASKPASRRFLYRTVCATMEGEKCHHERKTTLFKFILHSFRMFGFSTDLPRQIFKCLQCSTWTAVPEIGFRTAQDSKTLLYMFGRVRVISRQALDGL